MAFKLLCLAFALFYAASAAPESRIVGGTEITIQEFPHVAALLYFYPGAGIIIQRCVGSIVSSWHILTTAHCFTGAIIENMWVKAGSTSSLTGGVEIRIADVIKHPDYVQTPRTADIAVVFLQEPLRVSDSINVLFVPPQGTYLADGMDLNVISWGFETESGPQLEHLKTVTLSKVSIQECQRKYEDVEDVVIDEAMICASAPEKGTCTGDSGAPMVVGNVLVGLSSTFKDCGNDEYPDVFTRIDSYSDWIIGVAIAPGRSVSPIKVADVY